MTALIGLDWGTSSLRAWRLDATGAPLETRRAAKGILAVPAGGFAAAFAESVGDWRAAYPDAPVLMCGMIGARQGWVEAPYAPAPAGLADLAAALAPVTVGERIAARIVPGVSLADGARREVMRGEETQIVGAAGPGRRLVVLPGSHSKWALTQDARIVDFSTYMTGELFAALKDHTILGRGLSDAEPDADADADADTRAFAQGLEAAERGLAGALFQTRARGLIGDLGPATGAAFLSGVVIGAEIAEALARLESRPDSRAGASLGPVLLVGAPALTARYAQAFRTRGIAFETAGEDSAAAGLARVARAAGLF
jgi:2-dehydro-3-deoxygalactonokinase